MLSICLIFGQFWGSYAYRRNKALCRRVIWTQSNAILSKNVLLRRCLTTSILIKKTCSCVKKNFFVKKGTVRLKLLLNTYILINALGKVCFLLPIRSQSKWILTNLISLGAMQQRKNQKQAQKDIHCTIFLFFFERF